MDSLSIISANVRGFQTNIGDLTHSFVLKKNPDVVACVETFLNESIPQNFARIPGYSGWHRRDRVTGNFGGIAVCFREGLSFQPIEVDIPEHLEIKFFRLWTHSNESLLLSVCYRPQWQGSEPIDFLRENLDELLIQNSCKNLVIVGDMNQHLVARAFDEFLVTFGLHNHVAFPTHISGSSLDPVITDLPENIVECESLGAVGSSDHYAVWSNIKLIMSRDQARTRTIWLWDKANWRGFRKHLQGIDWREILQGEIDEKVKRFTDLILALQEIYVPHKTYLVKPHDQPWFGERCRAAADAKSKAWVRLKRRPSRRNRDMYKSTCKEMERTEKWAKRKWLKDTRDKLTGRSVGNKDWWNLMKTHQGFGADDSIPPLDKPGGGVATSSQEKADLLATYFSSKMKVPDANQSPPKLPLRTNKKLESAKVTARDIENRLKKIDVNKALGPDGVSPHTLKQCASELSEPLAYLYQLCLREKKWPRLWKIGRVIAIHKKKSKSSIKNYRPVSLLSVVGKIFEKIIAEEVIDFLDKNRLLNVKQFGFLKGKSTSDLLLQLSAPWQKSLDSGKVTYVIALDIAGAFDRVWHEGILERLESFGITGNLLGLFHDYLTGRTLRVVVNGYTSSEYPIEASVPQGSVVGPLLWNIYFNDILNLIPEAYAYADDCTLTFTCDKSNQVDTISKVNHALQMITEWGKRWQISLAPEKTQLLVISRNNERNDHNLPSIILSNKALVPQQSINILGIEVDSKLAFTNHVKNIAKMAACKLACIRRVSHFLDAKGCLTLYNSQVRSMLEYSPLVWSSCPPSYLQMLDRVQQRANRLIESKKTHQEPPLNFQSLQHRRNVSGLCVFYKAQIQKAAHLSELQVPRALRGIHGTRGAVRSDYELEVPFARTEQYLRSYIPRMTRVWNRFIRDVDMRLIHSMQQFKASAHVWCLRNL